VEKRETGVNSEGKGPRGEKRGGFSRFTFTGKPKTLSRNFGKGESQGMSRSRETCEKTKQREKKWGMMEPRRGGKQCKANDKIVHR